MVKEGLVSKEENMNSLESVSGQAGKELNLSECKK